jgi:L-malate glycosyltransferase
MKQEQPIRVAYVNHTGAVSGAERVLLNMVRTLDRSTYRPFVICPGEGGLAQLVKQNDVTWLPLPAVQARFTLHPVRLCKAAASLTRAIVALRETFSALDPDIVHANTVRAGIAASAAALGTGRIVVWHIHDNLPDHFFSGLIRFAARVLRPARIIAVSDSTAAAFRGPLAFKSTISTIHNGTDLSQFPLKSADSPELRSTLGVPDDAFLICAVGQICARKGLLELLEAFAIALKQSPNLHLVIAGSVVFEHEKGYFNLLHAVSTAREISQHVHFTGHVQNVSALLRAADLLVLNSRQEPFGLVLIEAMSSGTPVLATRVGGIPEIVQDAHNGWLVDKNDNAGLAEKMIQLSASKDLLQMVAERALRETCPRFSLEKFRLQLQKTYAELMPVQGGSRGSIGRTQPIGPCN